MFLMVSKALLCFSLKNIYSCDNLELFRCILPQWCCVEYDVQFPPSGMVSGDYLVSASLSMYHFLMAWER